MFEFLRDTVLCGSDGACAPEHEQRPYDRRPGEVISSHGGPTEGDHDPHFQIHLPWDDSSGRRKSMPMRNNRLVPPGSPLLGRSPRATLRDSRRVLRKSCSGDIRFEALGESFPCTGAAVVQEDALPGRGLCVSMQRGLGARTAQAQSFEESQASHTSEVGTLVPADGYAANVQDPLDRCFEGILKQLNPSAARLTFVRKLGQNEYEVDGNRINAGWLRLDSGSREAYVFDKTGPVEQLSTSLNRIADALLTRSARPPFPNFVHPTEANVPQAIPASSYNNSFYSQADTRSFYSQDAGSFYSRLSQPLAPGPKDPRLEAMRLANCGPPGGSLMLQRGVGSHTTTPGSAAPSRPLSPVMRTSQAQAFMQPQHPAGVFHARAPQHMAMPSFVAVRG